MTVSAGEPVSAAVVNAAFGSKTSDNIYVGVQDLNAPFSGPEVPNVQLALNNAGKVTYTVQSISAGGTIDVFNTGGGIQYRRVQSDGGDIQLSLTPFGVGHGLSDGISIIIACISNTNTIEILFNDATDGALLNGNAKLFLGDNLTVQYDSILERFVELGRNF